MPRSDNGSPVGVAASNPEEAPQESEDSTDDEPMVEMRFTPDDWRQGCTSPSLSSRGKSRGRSLLFCMLSKVGSWLSMNTDRCV